MNLTLVIGAPGQGKTPFCKKLIGGSNTGIASQNAWVFDINDEYGPRTKYPGQIATNLTTNSTEARARYVGDDIDAFVKIAMRKMNTVVIMEEATAFFRGFQKTMTSRMIINRIHRRNDYVFLFHSINRVPPEIFEIANYVVLFKTNDQEQRVKSKFFTIYDSFMEVKKYPDGKYKIIKTL